MTEEEAKPYVKPIPNWMPETRTVIVSWMMFSSFLIIVMCWWSPPPADSQLLNTLIGMYVGTGFITAMTWWMGSAKGSDANNKMQEKMADSIRPASAPVIPPVAPVPWWNRLTDGERAAITAAAPGDKKVEAIVAAPVTNKAPPDDLAYLVSKGLLTQERADTLKAT